MRYLILFLAMVSELVILAAIAVASYFAIVNESKICFIVVVLGLWTWHGRGIFYSWRPSQIKAVLAGTKKYGL